METDTAIAPHLRCPRLLNRPVGEDYVPMFPGYTVRPRPEVQQIVMGNFGVQSSSAVGPEAADAAMCRIVQSFHIANGPGFYELARSTDAASYNNVVAMAFWNDPAEFYSWRDCPTVAEWWHAKERQEENVGYFREIMSPRLERYETLLSDSDRAEGAGRILGGITERPIREHGYWGSSRDRMPLSQTDRMLSSGRLEVRGAEGARRIRIGGHENLTYIRSGQDWVDADEAERKLYLKYRILRGICGREILTGVGISSPAGIGRACGK